MRQSGLNLWRVCDQQIICPFCGQTFHIAVDTSQPSQRLGVDCEICCRPLEIIIECEDGEVVSLDAQPN
jgi:hypothetical protein